MQLIPVYLYPNKIDVFTNALAPWLNERYRQVYQRNLKIYRGVDNRIDLQIRNSDERAAPLVGSSVVFNLVERESQKLILKLDCTTVDANRGRFNVVIQSSALDSIEPGFYQYSLSLENRTTLDDGSYNVDMRAPLYCDSQYGTVGTIEIAKAGTGEPRTSTRITTFMLHDPAVTGYSLPKYYLSSLIDARPQYTDPQSLHTFQFNLKNYQGTAIIQGSIDEGATPHNWVDLDVLTFGLGETVRYFNITGKYNWFRIKQNAYQGNNAQFVVQQELDGSYMVDVDDGGQGYKVNEVIHIPGSQLGGADGVNDLEITVLSTNTIGRINANGIRFTGTSVIGYKTYVVGNVGPLTAGSIDKVLYR